MPIPPPLARCQFYTGQATCLFPSHWQDASSTQARPHAYSPATGKMPVLHRTGHMPIPQPLARCQFYTGQATCLFPSHWQDASSTQRRGKKGKQGKGHKGKSLGSPLLGTHHTKTNIIDVVPEARTIEVARRRTAVIRVVVPRTAPQPPIII